MGDDTQTTRVKVDSGMGILWFVGWLFTIAYAGLGFWQGVLGFVLWPWYLGMAVR